MRDSWVAAMDLEPVDDEVLVDDEPEFTKTLSLEEQANLKSLHM